MKDQLPAHRTIIMRCWAEQDELVSQRFWRFHLHWVDTNQRQSFADVKALLAALGDVFGAETALEHDDV